MAGNLLKKSDLIKEPVSVESSAQGGGVAKQPNTGGEAAICLKVYPEHHVAVVSSPTLGKKLISYSQSTGIRPGMLCAISTYAGVPMIKDAVNFGLNYKECAILDLDDWENPFSKMPEPNWSKELGEVDRAFSYMSIKKDPGEKVYAVDISGLKLGYAKTTLFHDYDAQINVSSKLITLEAKNYRHDSGVTYKTLVGETSDGGGYDTELISLKKHSSEELDNDTPFSFYREYKGNVEEALNGTKFEMPKFPGFALALKDVVKLTIVVLPANNHSFDKPTEASHTYLNRELAVSGGGKDSVNKKMLDVSKSDRGTLTKGGLEAKEGNVDLRLTFMEALTIYGDTFSYQAGDHTSSVMGDSRGLTAGETDEFYFGNISRTFQQNVSDQHLPVLEDSSYSISIFSDYAQTMKGDVVNVNYRYTTNILRNSYTSYEYGEAPDIDSFETKNSTIVTYSMISKNEKYSPAPDLSDDVFDRRLYSRDEGDTLVYLGEKDRIFYGSQATKTKSAIIDFGPQGFNVNIPKGLFYGKFDFTILDNKTGMYVLSDLFLDGKLIVQDDFYVDSKNIVLIAENVLYTKSESYYSESEKMAFGFEQYCQIFTTEDPGYDEDGKEKKGFVFNATVTEAVIQGEFLALVAGKNIAIQSEKDIGIVAAEQLGLSDSDGVP